MWQLFWISRPTNPMNECCREVWSGLRSFLWQNWGFSWGGSSMTTWERTSLWSPFWPARRSAGQLWRSIAIRGGSCCTTSSKEERPYDSSHQIIHNSYHWWKDSSTFRRLFRTRASPSRSKSALNYLSATFSKFPLKSSSFTGKILAIFYSISMIPLSTSNSPADFRSIISPSSCW